MKNIAEIEALIIQDFEFLEDWTDKYNLLMDMGKELAPFPESFKTDQYRIQGCQSKVWLKSHLNEDKRVVLEADSDALISKGLVALLIKVLNLQTPEDILHAPLGFIKLIGLDSHLSPNRANGLASMLKQIRLEAKVYAQQTASAS
jgi:cysteine desulfuration protein SufE